MDRHATTDERMQRIVKTLWRSDGTMKIYGMNTDGKLLTVVMEKEADKWSVTEITVSGRITGYFPIKTRR